MPTTIDGLTEEAIRYNIYAFGTDVKRWQRKLDRSRTPHTKARYNTEVAFAKRMVANNQARLRTLEIERREALTATLTRLRTRSNH